MMSCTVCNQRVGSIRLHKQKEGKSWKDFKAEKFCNDCRKRQPVKMKEERHSN